MEGQEYRGEYLFFLLIFRQFFSLGSEMILFLFRLQQLVKRRVYFLGLVFFFIQRLKGFIFRLLMSLLLLLFSWLKYQWIIRFFRVWLGFGFENLGYRQIFRFQRILFRILQELLVLLRFVFLWLDVRVFMRGCWQLGRNGFFKLKIFQICLVCSRIKLFLIGV